MTTVPFPAGTPACPLDGGGLGNLRTVEFGSGLLALGSCAHSAFPSLIWYSPDGHIWQTSAPPTLAHADVYSLIAADGLVVAAGQDTTDGFAAASWVSRDGLTWTRSSGDLGCAVIDSVAQFGSEFVAFGNKLANAPEFEGPPGVCEWVSSDGFAWQSVHLDTSIFPLNGGVFPVAVGPGGLVAAGSHAGPTVAVADLWTSPDGRTWKHLGGTPAGWGSIDTLLTGGPGYVAFGTNANGNVAEATSADGQTWTETPSPIQGALNGGPYAAVGAAGLACAGVALNTVDSAPIVWQSTDGVSWRAAPALPSGLSYLSIGVAGTTLVLAAATPNGQAAIVQSGP